MTRRPARAVNASIIDLGNRFRLLINEVDVVAPGQTAAQAARGARRLGLQTRPADGRRGLDLRRRRPPHRLQPGGDHGNAGGLRRHRRASKLVIIDDKTSLRDFSKELRCNEVYYALAGGFVS